MSRDNWGFEQKFQPETVNKAFDLLAGVSQDFKVLFNREDSRYGRGYAMTDSEIGNRFEAANRIVAKMAREKKVTGNYDETLKTEPQKALGVVFAAELRSYVVRNLEPKDNRTGGIVKASRGGNDDEMPESWGNSKTRLGFEWGVFRALLEDNQFTSQFKSHAAENGIDLDQMGRDINYLKATAEGMEIFNLSQAFTSALKMENPLAQV
jgi:hypothetical protein